MAKQDNYKDINQIPQEKFELVQHDRPIYDAKIETKSITYLGDAARRFSRNGASVAAFIIIILILLFAIIAPFVSKYDVSYVDGTYTRVRPKVEAFERSGFWDGSKSVVASDRYFIYLNAIGMGAEDTDGTGEITWDDGKENEFRAINNFESPYTSQDRRYRDVTVDSYYLSGFKYETITEAKMQDILEWEAETGLQVIYPMIDKNASMHSQSDANYWYKHSANGTPLNARGRQMELEDVMEEGLIPNYIYDTDGEVAYYALRDRNMVEVRILYYNYFQYTNGFVPANTFGTDALGYDIMVRVAQGTRLSLALASIVSLFNLTFGALFGALQGYYGGTIDLVMDRITDIIGGMPFTVIAILFQLHLVQTGKVSVFEGVVFAFCFQGWISTASRVRTQFYRFKNEEYILSARSMGAGDARLMIRHIFPNAIGTIITSSVLVIPSTIMSESSLSYIGVINFNSREMTSLGTMLSNGQGYLATDPHILFIPAIVISLMMISFNLFGNGLRDAFNPSLRGSED